MGLKQVYKLETNKSLLKVEAFLLPLLFSLVFLNIWDFLIFKASTNVLISPLYKAYIKLLILNFNIIA